MKRKTINTLLIILFISLSNLNAQVNLNVGDDFQTIIDSHPEGTTFIIKEGVHRMQTITARDGDTYLGELGANGEKLSIMKGSKVVDGFLQGSDANGIYYYLNNIVEDNTTVNHGDCLDDRDCQRCEDVFINGVPQIKVTSLTLMDQVNECFMDGNDLYLRANPLCSLVEISVNAYGIRAEKTPDNSGIPGASNVTVKNLIVEQYANIAQVGAIHAGYNTQTKLTEKSGDNWLVENNEVRFNHSAGIFVSDTGQMLNNYIHNNGQIGMRARGESVLIEGNESAFNCTWGGYNWGWEGGGSKFVSTNNIQILNNFCHDNNGPGLWGDIDNYGALYENNLCEYNNGPGIFHEISYDAIIRCNTLKFNKNDSPTTTGNVYGGNIFISNSSGVEVYHNTIICDDGIRGNGIMLICANRTSSLTGLPYFTENNHIYENDITYTENYGLSGLLINNCTGESNNVFENNNYHSVNTNYNHFLLGGYAATDRGDFTWIQNQGQETGSTMDGNLTATPNFTCAENTNEGIVSFKIFLEGPYDSQSGIMSLSLSASELIPLNQPYNFAPYNYTGPEILTSIPPNMVDWVLVEVREGTPNLSGIRGTATIETQAGILLETGEIVDVNGAQLSFNSLVAGQSYHFCIRHRNHLDVLSSTPISIGPYNFYDFTSAATQAFGTNQLKLMPDGKAVMFAADISQDGIIQTTDYDFWKANPAILNTYTSQDANLDGAVQTTDYDVWFLNKAKIGSIEIGF